MLLHVGTHKTATTSLQSTLSSASAELLAHGTLYPEAGRVGLAHHNIAWGLVGDDRFEPGRGFLDELADEVRVLRPPLVFLSSEDFEYLGHSVDSLRVLRRWIRQLGYKPLVVVSLRDVAGYLESLYAELVRHGLIEDFDLFVRSALSARQVVFRGWVFQLDYERLVASFAEVFGERSIVVIPFDGHDMVGRFLSYVPQIVPNGAGVGAMSGIPTDVFENVRMEDTELGQLLADNRLDARSPEDVCASQQRVQPPASFRLSEELRTHVSDTFGQQIERLVERYSPS